MYDIVLFLHKSIFMSFLLPIKIQKPAVALNYVENNFLYTTTFIMYSHSAGYYCNSHYLSDIPEFNL